MSFEPDNEVQDSTNNELLQNILIELKKQTSILLEVHDLEITDEAVDDGTNKIW